MEWSIASVDWPTGVDPEETEILFGVDSGLTGSYGRTYLVRHEAALKALHREGMVGSFRVSVLVPERPPRIEAGKWGSHQLVLVVEGGAEKRLDVSHHERDATLDVLEGLYRESGAKRELATLLEERLATTHEDEVRLAALAELAKLYAESPDEGERAVRHLCTWLALAHDDERAIVLLGELAERGRLDACDALERTYRALRRFEPLAVLCARRAALEPERRRELLLEAARLFEVEVFSPGRALDAALALLAERPGDDEVLARVDALAEKSGAWSTAAAGYRAAEQATEDPVHDAKLLWRIGTAYEKAGEVEPATQALQELTWLDPAHREALAQLVGLFAAAERHQPEVEALERLVELAEDDRTRIDWLTKLADTLENKLGDAVGAVAKNLAILAIDDHHDGALASLARLYEASESHVDLIAVLERRAERAGVSLRASLLAHAATVTELHLRDEEAAMTRWRAALNALPSHVEAMEALQRLFAEHGRFLELVNALEQHAIGVDDARAVESLVEAARIATDRLALDDRAIACYERARELAPRDERVLRALLSAYRKRAHPAPVIELISALLELGLERGDELSLFIERADWHRRAGHLPEALRDLDRALALKPKATEQRVALLLGRGDIARDVEPEAARRSYEEVLSLDPQNRDAFERLEPLLRASEDHAGLATIYERRAGFVADERPTWLCRAAKLHLSLGDPKRAAALALDAHATAWQDKTVQATLSEVGSQRPVWRDVLDQLEARTGEHGEGERLRFGRSVDVFIKSCQANAELDADEVLLRVARHYDKSRGAPKRALAHYRRAFRRNDRATDIERRIRALMKKLGRHTELIEHLRHVLDADLYQADDRDDLSRELADALDAVGQSEEAAQIRRRLEMGRVVAIAAAVVIAALALVWYLVASAD